MYFTDATKRLLDLSLTPREQGWLELLTYCMQVMNINLWPKKYVAKAANGHYSSYATVLSENYLVLTINTTLALDHTCRHSACRCPLCTHVRMHHMCMWADVQVKR